MSKPLITRADLEVGVCDDPACTECGPFFLHSRRTRRVAPSAIARRTARRQLTPKRKATMGTGKAGARYKVQRVAYPGVGLTCERCGAVATEVHHRPGDQPETPDWLDESRWTRVCHTCHAEIEAALMVRAEDGRFIGKRFGMGRGQLP